MCTCSKLKYKSPVEYLNLSNNKIGDQGVSALAATLALCRTIRDVDVADCGAGEAGMAAVGLMLGDNKTLFRLNLGGNTVGSQVCSHTAHTHGVQRWKSCGFGWGIAHGAVSRRPPISLYTIVAHTEGYTYDVGVWDLSIVQGPFSVAP